MFAINELARQWFPAPGAVFLKRLGTWDFNVSGRLEDPTAETRPSKPDDVLASAAHDRLAALIGSTQYSGPGAFAAAFAPAQEPHPKRDCTGPRSQQGRILSSLRQGRETGHKPFPPFAATRSQCLLATGCLIATCSERFQ